MTRTPARTIKVKIRRDGGMCAIDLPFDPRAIFGKLRAPVRVTLNGYSYRSTIFSMGGVIFIPLRKSNREAAGLAGNETLNVTIALDTAVREVTVPPDLARSFGKHRKAAAKWDTLSYSHRREHVEALIGAKKPQTRARRLADTLRMLEGIDSVSRRR
jgi:hypothetical protein